ncbi:hypothetical protein POVWA2_075690 [Plasmodium ovale wallikeri]|nr:hypothetical protein POVWA2_075690 [Plasmodium ovale wallikeri]
MIDSLDAFCTPPKMLLLRSDYSLCTAPLSGSKTKSQIHPRHEHPLNRIAVEEFRNNVSTLLHRERV